MKPDRVYFDALAHLPLPPLLPGMNVRARREFQNVVGDDAYVPRASAAHWLFRVACAHWARREARSEADLYALLVFVNTRHVFDEVPDVELLALARYVARTYGRAPRRRTKKRWRRYEVVPFDVSAPACNLVSAFVM